MAKQQLDMKTPSVLAAIGFFFQFFIPGSTFFNIEHLAIGNYWKFTFIQLGGMPFFPKMQFV